MESKHIDQYMSLSLTKDPNSSDLLVRLINPVPVNHAKDLYVALCSLNYEYEGSSLHNCSRAIFAFAGFKYAGVLPNPSPGLWLSGTRTKKMISCEIENAEHSPSSLVSALNRELVCKLPSTFPSGACNFIYNPDINRVELTFDGSDVLPEDDRVTLVVYWPLSRYLGLTQSPVEVTGYCFGAPAPPTVKPSYIRKVSHALAEFPPYLPRPNFINLFLDCIEQHQNETYFVKDTDTFVPVISPLLASFQRPALPLPSPLVNHIPDIREYKRINSDFTILRELRFQVRDEHSNNFQAFKSMKVSLHFVQK